MASPTTEASSSTADRSPTGSENQAGDAIATTEAPSRTADRSPTGSENQAGDAIATTEAPSRTVDRSPTGSENQAGDTIATTKAPSGTADSPTKIQATDASCNTESELVEDLLEVLHNTVEDLNAAKERYRSVTGKRKIEEGVPPTTARQRNGGTLNIREPQVTEFSGPSSSTTNDGVPPTTARRRNGGTLNIREPQVTEFSGPSSSMTNMPNNTEDRSVPMQRFENVLDEIATFVRSHCRMRQQENNECRSSSAPPEAPAGSPGGRRRRECCIYKVPGHIKKDKEDFYEPKVISIGPVFGKKEHLRDMDQLKDISWDTLRAHRRTINRDLDVYKRAVRDLFDEICDCYQDKQMLNSWSREDFITMITRDAIFLLRYMLKEAANVGPGVALPGYAFPRVSIVPRELIQSMEFVATDLLISENQLPFFVIHRMFQLAFGGPPQAELHDIARRTLCAFNVPGRQYLNTRPVTRDLDVAHLLDLLRTLLCSEAQVRPHVINNNPTCCDVTRQCCGLLKSCFCLPIANNDQPQRNDILSSYSATAKLLNDSRVKLVVANDDVNPLHVTFDRRTRELSIPHIAVNKKTEAFWRNLMQFERCHYSDCIGRRYPYLIDYIFFFDSLIDTAEDIQILEKKGILRNVLGSDEIAAQLFNTLMVNSFTDIHNTHYSEVCRQLMEFADGCWNRRVAIFKREYFAHVWAKWSLIFAATLFICSILQTILPYLVPQKQIKNNGNN